MFRNTVFIFFLSAVMTIGQVASAKKYKKMLLAGDSWGLLMCVGAVFPKAFIQNRMIVPIPGCLTTTRHGLRAANWLDSEQHASVMRFLKEDQNIEAIYLSLGGNDFLNSWNKDMTGAEESQLLEGILMDIRRLVGEFLALRPDLKILVSGYDYARFSEARWMSHYQRIFKKAGEPRTWEMHKAILRLHQSMVSLIDGKNVFYIGHYGLMHYHRGQREESILPRSTLPPEEISPPHDPGSYGGIPELELDKTAMIRAGKVTDSYHLTPDSYVWVADHAIKLYLKDWFKKKGKIPSSEY